MTVFCSRIIVHRYVYVERTVVSCRTSPQNSELRRSSCILSLRQAAVVSWGHATASCLGSREAASLRRVWSRSHLTSFGRTCTVRFYEASSLWREMNRLPHIWSVPRVEGFRLLNCSDDRQLTRSSPMPRMTGLGTVLGRVQ